LPQILSLTSKLFLLNLVGHEDHVGHGLVSVERSSELERSLRNEVRDATASQLSAEPDLYRLMTWTKLRAGENEPELRIPSDPEVGCALLRSSVSEVRSQGMGTRTIQVEKVLYWDGLVDLLGGEDVIRRIVEQCRQQKEDPSTNAAVELAERYLGGWRPERI
jgi:hypothetical protein